MPAYGALEVIYASVGLDQGLFSGDAFDTPAVLHAQDPLVSLFMDMLEYVEIVDFTGARFFSAGIVPNMEGPDFRPRPVDIGNTMTCLPLLFVAKK
jgi:hypothetical protein